MFTEHHTWYSSEVWETDRKDTMACSATTLQSSVYKFSQVTMRGTQRTETLGMWVQAKLWAVLGLQRSNKLP